MIDALKNQINNSIDNIIPKTEKLKQEQEKDIIRKFNTELTKMKKRLEE
jgi:hypothetical protein